jgi:hypothetical protein
MRKSLAATLGVSALAVLALACGGTSTNSSTSNPATTGAAPATTTAAAKPAGPQTSFGDGTWIVGQDIMAGTYRATVPGDSLVCYWEREKDLNGDMGSILANDNVHSGGHATVTIKTTDKGFKTSGCGTWSKVG